MEEAISPFLTKKSRRWAHHLELKISILSAFLLLISFILSFYNLPLAHLLLSFTYFLVGTPAIINAIEDIRNLEINIDILMTLAAFFSILVGSGFEGALLLVLFEFSASVEHTVTHKAKGAIHSLHELSPKVAYVIEGTAPPFQKSVKEITAGEKLLIKAGEIIPLDGIVINGASSLNLVHLTGESAPVLKKIDDEVPAGAKNLESALTISVTRTSSDSTLSKIIKLITQAQDAKPNVQRWLDRFGKIYSTSIILLTLFFAATLPVVFSIPYMGEEGGIYRALAFLIAASPCALIIATPTAYLSAISSCARKGILLKGGITLDALSSCTSVAFDKTGTLTTGQIALDEIIPIDNPLYSEEDAIAIAAGLEHHIVHPIAKAVENLSTEKNITPMTIDNFSSEPGYGLKGQVTLNGKTVDVAIGLTDYILSLFPDKKTTPLEQRSGIKSLLKIGDHLYLFIFSDTIREYSKQLIEQIKQKNSLTPIMLTGDNKNNAEDIANKIGIDQIFSDLRPEDKLNFVSDLSSKGLAMVGDGINDAPALARSTVGISMGKIGSATAVDASDVVLLNDDLHLLPWLFTKAKKTLSIVKQNLTLALIVIVFATTPALMGYIPLWLAVILHEGGTVLVGLNSLRLLK